jgi:very-short-patch-repair endonuclease
MPAPPINRRIYKSPFAQDFTSPLRGGRSPQGNGWGTDAETSVERARELRKHATPAERLLWSRLRKLRPLGYHFRRQAPFGRYIADFACHRASLIVELDGLQHGEPSNLVHDERRTMFLNGRGYTVLRFWNLEVLRNCNEVVGAILRAAPPPVMQGEEPCITTSPQGGGQV